MKNAFAVGLLTQALFGFVLAPLPAQTPTPAPAMPPPSAALPTPAPTFGDHWTEVLPDRRVTFRLLAPKVDAVSVLAGLKSPWLLSGYPSGTKSAQPSQERA